MSQIKIKQIEGLQTKLDQIDAQLVSGSLKQRITAVSHGFTAGNVITFYQGSWILADASNADKLGRLVVESVEDADTFVAVRVGTIEISGWGLTPGRFYVVTEAGDGSMAEFISITDPNYTYSNPILQAITSEIADVLPWRPSLGYQQSAIGQLYTQSDEQPLTTTGNYSATGVTLTYTPFTDSTVEVYVNGIAIVEGNGNKDGGAEAYFSRDGGTTALLTADLEAGDELYWNGDIAGFNLGPGDFIDLTYMKSSLD